MLEIQSLLYPNVAPKSSNGCYRNHSALCAGFVYKCSPAQNAKLCFNQGLLHGMLLHYSFNSNVIDHDKAGGTHILLY